MIKLNQARRANAPNRISIITRATIHIIKTTRGLISKLYVGFIQIIITGPILIYAVSYILLPILPIVMIVSYFV